MRASVGALGLMLACTGPGIDSLDDEAGSTSDPGGGTQADASDTGDDQPFDPLVCGSWDPPQATPAGTPPPEQPCSEGEPCPRFTDVTIAAGLDTLHYVPTHPSTRSCIFPRFTESGPSPATDCEPQWFTAGVTIGDVDDDGLPDVYMTRLAAPDHLFVNRGDGTFVDVAADVGLGACSYTNGAQFGDIDDDGDQDLLVTGMGSDRHFLFINQLADTGVLEFEDQAEARGFALTSSALHSGESVTLGDYDRDGWLDAYVSEWLRYPLFPSEPGDWPLHGGRLLHNRGAAQPGVFEDVTDALGVSLLGNDDEGIFAFAASFVDLDDDGWQELAIAVDFHHSRLFHNLAGQLFVDATSPAGINSESNAMGSTFADLDLDGDLDWYVTSIAEPDECMADEPPPCWLGTGNRMYENLGGLEFARIEDELGVRDGDWAWGTVFFDLDNDGDQDLALANGWPGRDLAGGLSQRDTPMRLWINQGPGLPMLEQGELRGVDDRQQGRGLVGFDYDVDGDLDLLVANHAGRPTLLRNEGGNLGGWLRIAVEGSVSNRDGRGAKLRVQVDEAGPWQVREVGVGSHFLGEGERVQHFGLAGAATVHRVEVEWPASGIVQTFTDVPANQTLQVVEAEP
ncbi:CRTAC1 family protein [Nannocystaceae bacterium ST9]